MVSALFFYYVRCIANSILLSVQTKLTVPQRLSQQLRII